MAKIKGQTVSTYVSKRKKRGTHSKSASKIKSSKNYAKAYRGQGR